jgi:hypothetical protein
VDILQLWLQLFVVERTLSDLVESRFTSRWKSPVVEHGCVNCKQFSMPFGIPVLRLESNTQAD